MKHPMPADPGFRQRVHDFFALMPADACEGLVVKAGRTISVCEGKAWQHQAGGPETLCATMTATIMTVQGRGLTH